MEKRAHLIYQKRFCVLHGGYKVLYYFLQPSSVSAQGFIDLSPGCKVTRTDKHTFTIYDITKDRTFNLSACSTEDADQWTRTLQAIITK